MAKKQTPQHILYKLKPHPSNPRFIKDPDFERLCMSILDFPQMLQLRGIVHETDGTILGGRMRWEAIMHLVEKGIEVNGNLEKMPLEQVNPQWFINADTAGLTDEQKREFLIKDNTHFGQWDTDILANEFNAAQLGDWGVPLGDWSQPDFTPSPGGQDFIGNSQARSGNTHQNTGTFEIPLEPENKDRLQQILHEIKNERQLYRLEDALMYLVNFYTEYKPQ